MTVVHITFDFPDIIDKTKTKAVKNLVLSQDKTNNIVFSLNRTAVRIHKMKVHRDEHGYSFYILGLPFGILLYLWMFLAYRRIYKVIVKENIKPNLIHAHKLTFEGIIAYLLARKLNIPYIITVRGNTDLNLLFYKRLYHKIYGKVVQSAQKLIFLAPWTIKPIQSYFKKHIHEGKYEIVPNIVNFSLINGEHRAGNKRFITVFHFKTYKLKNIARVIKAFDKVFDKFPDYGFDIVGDGPNKHKILADISRCKHPQNFSLKGAIENSKLSHIYSSYHGFILPSFPETFGLVFVEALSAGIPIIYSKNAAIDGYFNEHGVGIGVNHKSVDEIAAAIEKIIVNNEEYKRNAEKMISSGYLNQFSKTAVGDKYSRIVSGFIATSDKKNMILV